MSKTRKERRAAAAKAARTIAPVAVAVDTKDAELRTAYRQVEDVENDNLELVRTNQMLMDSIDKLDAEAGKQHKALTKRAYWYFTTGTLLGYAISFLPHVAA